MTTTDGPTALVRMLKEREKRLATVEDKLAALCTASTTFDLEIARMEKTARQRLSELATSIQTSPLDARKALKALVPRPLLFTPMQKTEGKGYRLSGELALELMFAGESGGVLGGVLLASPGGTETLPDSDFEGWAVRIVVDGVG